MSDNRIYNSKNICIIWNLFICEVHCSSSFIAHWHVYLIQ